MTSIPILYIYLIMGKKPDSAPKGMIKLIDLPRLLRASGATATYSQCYTAAVNGLIDAERNSTDTRWIVDPQKLPSVIKHFSLLKDDDEKED